MNNVKQPGQNFTYQVSTQIENMGAEEQTSPKRGVALYGKTFSGLEFDSFHIAMIDDAEKKKLLELTKTFAPKDSTLKSILDKLALGSTVDTLSLVEPRKKKYICTVNKCKVVILDLISSLDFQSMAKNETDLTLKVRLEFQDFSCDEASEAFYNTMLKTELGK